jgi:4-hydroxy-3-methylbut-2-enyl diphosphate reductase
VNDAVIGERRGLAIATALRVEAWALRGVIPGARVHRVGMGPRRARRAARALRLEAASAVAVAGVCGALDARLGPGAVVVASALLGPEGQRIELEAGPLAAALARAGIEAQVGAIACVARAATGAGRAALAARGARAVDMESFWRADAAAGRPFAVLRVVLDGPQHELWRPDLPRRLVTALRRLRAAAPALADWADAVSAGAADAFVGSSAGSASCYRARAALA